MAVTRDQAMTEDRFHENDNRRKDGTCYVWRRNGQTKTWKTRPTEFRVPVKYGLYGYHAITDVNAEQYHTERDCPFGNRW